MRPRAARWLGHRAHPRSRGENPDTVEITVDAPGSSPLTRGKFKQRLQHRAPEGLIPAHAGKTVPFPTMASNWRAHPRSRGENYIPWPITVPLMGSSPLTRGKPLSTPRSDSRKRLIPAHAGKTAATPKPAPVCRAHPRSRGENAPNEGYEAKVSGSSPLTRGKHQGRRERRRRVGLIPAHAGKTAGISPNKLVRWAHPRSRGENSAPSTAFARKPGSSPLTRGKLRQAWEQHNYAGLIPAHAGKTVGEGGESLGEGAHPRSRGENAPSSVPSSWYSGSSPLTRGKRVRGRRTRMDTGLIPAHAGKTRGHRPPGRDQRAHPRSRGENTEAAALIFGTTGSSPLTRGKPATRPPPPSNRRLIPAHAGKTGRRRAPGDHPRAHPRSRGENALAGKSAGDLVGSSPLTRGKHDEVAVRGARRGLIPAHAGKTCKAGPPTGCSGAHPRSRGENFASTVPMVLAGGSSPLTRGKPIFIACNFHECGLIPAHAGKTHLDALTASVLGAHPRSRGENGCLLLAHDGLVGSSPLTRGKR